MVQALAERTLHMFEILLSQFGLQLLGEQALGLLAEQARAAAAAAGAPAALPAPGDSDTTETSIEDSDDD